LNRIKKVNVAGKNNNVNFTQLNESVEYSNAEKSAIIRLKFSLLAYYLSNKTGADPNLAEDVELTSSNKPILTNTELMNKFMNWGTFAPEVMYSIAAKLTGRKVEIFKYCEHKQIDQQQVEGFICTIRPISKLFESNPSSCEFEPDYKLQKYTVLHSKNKRILQASFQCDTIRIIHSALGKKSHFDILVPKPIISK